MPTLVLLIVMAVVIYGIYRSSVNPTGDAVKSREDWRKREAKRAARKR